jgi:TAP-like protein
LPFFGLYQKSQAIMAFDAFQKAADKGDYSGLYLMQLLFDKIIPKTYFGDMFSKGFSADLQPNVNYRKKYRANYDSTLLGPNYSLLLWGLSDGWSNYTIPEEYRQLRPSATETLIISGDLDPSTPADFAKNILLPTLKNGKQIIRKNMSHSDIIDLKSIDDRKFIIEYLEKGTLNENYLQNETINFTPKRSFNKLAKWGYPVVFFASIFN